MQTTALLLLSLSFAEEPRHTEADAVVWAFEALTNYSEKQQPYIRFVLLPSWADPEWIGAVDYAVNSAASHSPILRKADLHAGGWLLAYDLSLLAPDPVALAKLIYTWDSLAVNDPYFHIPQENIKGVRAAFLSPHLEAALAKSVNGKTDKRVDVLLAQFTRSTGGIYRADWFIEQLLTSEVGKYLEFRQVESNPRTRHTPVQEHLRRRGFFLESAFGVGGERGALILISKVTGKMRLVFAVYGIATRTPLLITYDIRDNKRQAADQFARNLITFTQLSDANEIISPLSNGLLEYLLSNADGEIQRSAPDFIVADHTKPDGHTKILESGMSCVVCHAKGDGYNVAPNDMKHMLGADIDFFGLDFSLQLNRKHLNARQVVDLLARRYGEPLEKPDGVLGRARRDFTSAVNRITNYPLNKDDPRTSVHHVGLKIKRIYHKYRFESVDATQAALELGLKGVELNVALPPTPAGTEQDIIIAFLKNGAKIAREDFEPIFGTMATDIYNNLERQK